MGLRPQNELWEMVWKWSFEHKWWGIPRNRSLMKVEGQRNDMTEFMLHAVGSSGMWRVKGRLENHGESGSPVRNLL